MIDILSALYNTKGAYFGPINKPKEACIEIKNYLGTQERINSYSGGKLSAKLAAAYSELALAQLECGEPRDVISLQEKSSAMRKMLPMFNLINLYNLL